MLLRKIITVHGKNHTELINILCGQNVDVADGAIYIYRCALKGWARIRWEFANHGMQMFPRKTETRQRRVGIHHTCSKATPTAFVSVMSSPITGPRPLNNAAIATQSTLRLLRKVSKADNMQSKSPLKRVRL
jgi:hypothetical protein